MSSERACYHGPGLATLDNGSSYEGEFDFGIPHGTGTLTWPDGITYETNT